MRKRLFSILLALCMVLCLVPTTAFIRLRDMGLFEYHNILEYISNELNLGGVSQ